MRIFAKSTGLVFAGALLAVLVGGAMQIHAAIAATPVTPTGATTLETIACNSGVSPCTIGATSTTVLNADPQRMQCLLQNVGTTDFYCIQGAGTVTTSNMHFILKAASAANKGDGGSFTCNQGPAVWRGVIICLGSAASGTLTASAAKMAGF